MHQNNPIIEAQLFSGDINHKALSDALVCCHHQALSKALVCCHHQALSEALVCCHH